jgi:hypothetical protein
VALAVTVTIVVEFAFSLFDTRDERRGILPSLRCVRDAIARKWIT